MIAKYSVRYGLPYGVMATAETTGYYFTATGLTPYTSYMFQVAAINSAGQRGQFSDPFIRDTKLGVVTFNLDCRLCYRTYQEWIQDFIGGQMGG